MTNAALTALPHEVVTGPTDTERYTSCTRLRVSGQTEHAAYELFLSRETSRRYTRRPIRVTWSARRRNVRLGGWATWSARFETEQAARTFLDAKLETIRAWAARLESEAA